MSTGKAMIINLTVVWPIQNISSYKMRYFPEPHTDSKYKIEVDLDLANYATKSDLICNKCWYVRIF